ncbi:alpha/beta hydrolase [Asticcacaulis sp. DXS10W]|uniref:Alpha/beta hydrolase n=1 Tax=Asticcacaulis currens TaxID=2984210 RepID=A0ABT5IE89_9CAUL|nr:alpha/beta hydrolase [Asticcacaulis currens]MDC7694258.1 alpha/beta hydrolase [Asticcacaulis currens]
MKRRTFLSSAIAMAGLATSSYAHTSTPVLSPADFSKGQKFARTRFGDIAYYETGKGQAALFLHGFPLNGYQWRHQLSALSPLRHCIAPDFLGVGATRVNSMQSVTPSDQAAMLAELLDTLKIDSVDLIANDSGGAVAQLFLVNNPGRVRTLLLTNCDTEKDCPPPQLVPLIELARTDTFIKYYLGPSLADKAKARSPQGLIGATFTRPHEVKDATIEMYLAPLVANRAGANAYLLALEDNSLAGIETKLRQVDTPVRIVWGTGDTVFRQDSPAYLDGLFRNSRGVRRIDGAKLFFAEEYPAQLTAELTALWS